MTVKPESPGSSSSSSSSDANKYRGVRFRKWGKWVSEVRLPNSRDRIWLGSYDSPEKAARAFDAASFCLRGNKAHLNFPHDPPPPPPISNARSSFTHKQIQQVAARHAYSYSYSSYNNYDKPATAMATATATLVVATEEEETASDGFSSVEETVDWSFLSLLMSPASSDFCYHFLPSSGEF